MQDNEGEKNKNDTGSGDESLKAISALQSFFITSFEWTRSILRTLEGTKHPEVDLGIAKRTFAAFIGMVLVILGMGVVIVPLQPNSASAMMDSFRNVPVISYGISVLAVVLWTTFCLCLRKNGSFHEHVVRSAVYPILAITLVVIVVGIAAVVVRMAGLAFSAFFKG